MNAKKISELNARQHRQGDVFCLPVSKMPEGCVEIPLEKGRIVLAHGEVTGHAHAIAVDPAAVVNAAIRKAQLFAAPSGDVYLHVKEPVSLTHEEHTQHNIQPGFYEVPIQVDMTADKMPRRVAD